MTPINWDKQLQIIFLFYQNSGSICYSLLSYQVGENSDRQRVKTATFLLFKDIHEYGLSTAEIVANTLNL